MTFDLTFDISFASPLATVCACSIRGVQFMEKHFGEGAVSCEVKQSFLPDICDCAKADGLSVLEG